MMGYKIRAAFIELQFSKCGLLTSTFTLTRELVSATKFSTLFQAYWIRNLVWNPQLAILTSFQLIWYTLTLENHGFTQHTSWQNQSSAHISVTLLNLTPEMQLKPWLLDKMKSFFLQYLLFLKQHDMWKLHGKNIYYPETIYHFENLCKRKCDSKAKKKKKPKFKIILKCFQRILGYDQTQVIAFPKSYVSSLSLVTPK